jgi:small subunit ribosomal protein S1
MEVKGIVKNLTDYGAFVDLGATLMASASNMAWKRVKHPSEIVNVGDEITVKVLKFDRERTVCPWAKQLGEDPWVAIAKVTQKVLTDWSRYQPDRLRLLR